VVTLLVHINVSGGSSVMVTQTNGNAVNTTDTMGAVTVTGSANTMSVSATAPKIATASASVAGVVANSVTVNDVNYASATKAGTITSVTASGYTTLAINDNALTTLSVTNGSGNIIIDNSGLTTATNKTLAMTADGLTGGTLDDADIYTTLNVTTANNNSTLANVTFGALTALTVAGTKTLTLTSTAGMSALKTATVSGSAGLTANVSGLATVTAVDTSASTGTSTITIDSSKATYTGGAGVDKVTTTALLTKAIDLGAGDDMLTLWSGTTTSTATVAGGLGSDTLSMTAADAATAGGSATFAGKVSGFEKLTLTGATNQTIDLKVLGNYNDVTTSGGNGLTLTNLPTAGKLTLTGAGTAYTITNADFTVPTTDVLNLTLTDGSGAAVAFRIYWYHSLPTLKPSTITTVDTQATPSGTFL
jgi:S-layer protein